MINKIIEVNKLVKVFKETNKKAVNEISFHVNEGEFFAFLGVNGAGKSTTINILCTLFKKNEGTAKVCGYEVGKQDDEIRQNIGVVFQGRVLDDVLSVKDNLIFRGTFYKIPKDELEKKIVILAQKLGIEENLNQKYASLSGGQRRKVDIARALIGNPKILFLDEPTTGLDPKSRIDLWNIINSIRKEQGTTIFLTTHYMEEVNNADRVAIIDDGELLVIDTPQSLKNKYSLDTIKLTVAKQDKERVEKVLNGQKIKFNFISDTFIFYIKNSKDFLDTLTKLKSHLTTFEVIKGDMDSVFLNVVGRKLINDTNN